MRRRQFLKSTGLAMGAAALPRTGWAAAPKPPKPPRPNVLWISVEDISPDLGCYGDAYAVTPSLDKFASQGTRFDACFAHMGVCAPARSGIITGMYPTSIGTNHMRCKGVPQPEARCFTEYLRAAGYYCTNRSKTDYQFDSPVTAWDRCGRCDDWRGRRQGQPFFCVINLTTTHESQIRNPRRRKQADDQLGPNELHDPAKATLPPYYPDTPRVRADWAQYYDIITLMDKQVADILKQLDADGLADDTIVWFWGDHGRGLPRGKRWLYDSGLRVPLLIRVPPKWRTLAAPGKPDAFKPGAVAEQLVSFVDFAPTMLSLCGVPIQAHIQGQAFLGPQKAPPRRTIFGARDRVDEAFDTIRCVRDKRFKYIRNFRPHLSRGLHLNYMDLMPTMQEMRRLHAEGKLRGAQLQYFEPTKPVEELYDTQADPHEVHNLAADPKHKTTLERLRAELFAWMRRTGDFAMLPEPEFDALKRPDDRYEATSAPGATPTPNADGSAAVTLTCATPGASIACRISGSRNAPPPSGIFLRAKDATLHGTKPLPRNRGPSLTGWRNSGAWVSWQVELKKAGRIPVHVCWGCAGKQRSTYVLRIAGQELKGASEPTGGWTTFKTVKLGDVDIPKPGTYTLTIKPVPKNGPFQMDLVHVVLDGRNLENQALVGPWQLYSRPLLLWPGQVLDAKACRLGFRDSTRIRYRVGDAGVPVQTAEARPHWRRVVDKSGVVERVLALKQLDGQGQKALDAYLKALGDPAASVRYWALLGIHQCHDAPAKPQPRKQYADLFRRCLKDPSPAVRIAAAHALCDWGEPDAGLPVLVAGLKEPLHSAAHYAITALEQLGDKVPPYALPAIEEAMKRGGYVRRVGQRLLPRLRAQ